jgi:hypothetical protein
MPEKLRPTPELEDALRRLARGLGPFANAGEKRPAPPQDLNPGKRLPLRAIAGFAVALVAAAILTALWAPEPPRPSPPQTVAVRTPPEDDVARLRSALASAEQEAAALRVLLAEEARKAARPRYWFENVDALQYRSPWPPR